MLISISIEILVDLIIIGSGRTKLETEEQFAVAAEVVRSMVSQRLLLSVVMTPIQTLLF